MGGGVYWRQYFGVFGWLSSLHFGQASWVLEWDKMQNTQVLEYECGWLVVLLGTGQDGVPKLTTASPPTPSIWYKCRRLVDTCHENLMIILCFDPRLFLKRILWCSQCDDHPENNLAKFGCILDMKFRKNKIKSFYILGYLLELIIKI